MRRLLAISLLALAGWLVPSTSDASVVIGPFVDFRGLVDVPPAGSPSTIVINTRFWRIRDRIEIDISLRTRLGGIGYVESDTDDFSGNLRVFTVYGVDLDPRSPILKMTGFDPTNPEVGFPSPEQIIGNSGRIYESSQSSRTTPSGLANLLPTGADLTPFDEADPRSFFQVFVTEVPGSDFAAVPEPATFALASFGALSLVVGSIRRRRAV